MPHPVPPPLAAIIAELMARANKARALYRSRSLPRPPADIDCDTIRPTRTSYLSAFPSRRQTRPSDG